MTPSAYTVEAAKEYGIGQSVNGLGKRPLIRGFFVVSPEGRRVRAFAQMSSQKWTPELEASLRAKAEEWAAILSERRSAA